MPLQTKLKIGKPNDKYEQEADRIADRVMRRPDAGVSANIKGVGNKASRDLSSERCG